MLDVNRGPYGPPHHRKRFFQTHRLLWLWAYFSFPQCIGGLLTALLLFAGVSWYVAMAPYLIGAAAAAWLLYYFYAPDAEQAKKTPPAT